MQNMFLEQVPNQMEAFDFKSNVWWGDNSPARKQNVNRCGGADDERQLQTYRVDVYIYICTYLIHASIWCSPRRSPAGCSPLLILRWWKPAAPKALPSCSEVKAIQCCMEKIPEDMCNCQVSTLIWASRHVQIMPFWESTRTQPFLQFWRAETKGSTLLFQNCRRLQQGKCATIKREPTRENIHGPGLLLLDDAARLK